MNLKKHLTFSNLLYLASVLFALGVLIKVGLDYYGLPPGACPFDNNRPLLYAALIFITAANLGPFIYDYTKKLRRKGND